MAQNDPVYVAGDRVRVYESGQVAARVEAGETANDGNPRLATVTREHPNEPGTLEVLFDDGASALITDQQSLRLVASA